MLWKSYIDRGRGLTSYFNELFLLFGFYTIYQQQSFFLLLIIALIYVIICFILGWAYFKWQWQLAETEVQNQYNLFVKEMRKKFK